MPEPSNTASSDEVVLKQNPSWFRFIRSFFLAFLFVVIGLALFIYPVTGYEAISGIIALLLLLFAAVVLVAAIVEHYSTEYSLTKTGMVKTRGILSKDVVTIPFDKITDIRLKKSFVERILGIGNIYIDTAGENGKEMILRGVPDPDKSYKMILGMMKKD